MEPRDKTNYRDSAVSGPARSLDWSHRRRPSASSPHVTGASVRFRADVAKGGDGEGFTPH